MIVTPSRPLAPRATTSITIRTDPLGPTVGDIGRRLMDLISRPSAAAGGAWTSIGATSALAASDVRRILLLMIKTVGTAR
ncbi:hypothetical protein GCM10023259_061830 [Thermocatellispora tengchongensis]